MFLLLSNLSLVDLAVGSCTDAPAPSFTLLADTSDGVVPNDSSEVRSTGLFSSPSSHAAGGGGRGSDLCLTAGWPLLTGVAFSVPLPRQGQQGQQQVTVVLMNEADTALTVTLYDSGNGGGDDGSTQGQVLSFDIAGRAIQSLVY